MCGSLQGLNVAYFTLEAVYQISGSVWVVAALVMWEGLLGGAAYVRTFYCISTKVARAAAWRATRAYLHYSACPERRESSFTC